MLLNITVDHLDRYPNFDAYAASKIRIFENQRPGDIAVLNGSDPLVRSLSEPLKSTKLYYASLDNEEEGAVNNGTRIRFRFNESKKRDNKASIAHLASRNRWFLNVSNLKLIGRHNLENAAAAALAALAAGAPPETFHCSNYSIDIGCLGVIEKINTLYRVDMFQSMRRTPVTAQCFLDCFR